MKKPQCKNCLMFNHWTYQCFKKPPKKKTKPAVIKRKSISKKIDWKWIETKNKWYKANPSVDGYYWCHYCGRVLVKDDELNDFGVERLTLDHKVNRHTLELKYDINNLLPCCARCNSLKGSRSYENFCREFYPHLVRE